MATVNGQRRTRQRQLVLDLLKSARCHPTAAELFDMARAEMPRISLGTVYRNLEVLTRSGVIRKLRGVGTEARFDGDPTQHHHVRCVECGRIDDVRDLPEDFVTGEVQNLGGYDIVGFRLDFLGICPACRVESKSDGDRVLPQKYD